MHWIIQDNLHREEGYEKLLSALDRMGLPYDIVKVVPFVGEMDPDLNPSGEVIVIGAYTLTYECRTCRRASPSWLRGPT